jgi:hypothetical protein
MNSRITLSSPSPRQRSSATVAALTAAGSVTMGSEAMSSARFRARTLKRVARAAMIRSPAVLNWPAPPPVPLMGLAWRATDPLCVRAGIRLHPFVPVSAIPWIKVRWVRKNKITIGAVAAVAPAITQAQFVV